MAGARANEEQRGSHATSGFVVAERDVVCAANKRKQAYPAKCEGLVTHVLDAIQDCWLAEPPLDAPPAWWDQETMCKRAIL